MRQGKSWSGHERNCCFLNTGLGDFATVSSVTGFDFPDDSRAIATTDWDSDGRTDVWISSRTAPRIRLLRNQHPTQKNSISFLLRGTTCNRDAIGARLELHFGSDGAQRRIQTVRAGEGFLAQSSKWVSFGLNREDKIDRLVIHWPGGEKTTIGDLEVNSRYVIKEGSSTATPWTRTKSPRLASSIPKLPPPEDSSRIVTLTKPQLPALEYLDRHNKLQQVFARTVPESDPDVDGILVILWSTSCPRCVQELEDVTDSAEELRRRKIQVVALCVDPLVAPDQFEMTNVDRVLQATRFPFKSGRATENTVRNIETAYHSLIDLQPQISLPCSLLTTKQGELVTFYIGAVSGSRVVQDAQLLSAGRVDARQAAVPFSGTWITEPIPPYPQDIALKLVEQGDTNGAIQYLHEYLRTINDSRRDHVRTDLADVFFLLGRLHIDQGEDEKGVAAYRQSIKVNPKYRKAHINLADQLFRKGNPLLALQHFDQAIKLDSGDPSVLVAQGVAYAQVGRAAAAEKCYRQARQLQPDNVQACTNLARLLHGQGSTAEAVELYRLVLEQDPSASNANNLAWILATGENANVRDPENAVKWARYACNGTRQADVRFMTTLAVAYSEAKMFDEAIRTARIAIESADRSGSSRIATTLRKHVRWYEAGKTYLEGRAGR